jgi:hypothetical protein
MLLTIRFIILSPRLLCFIKSESPSLILYTSIISNVDEKVNNFFYVLCRFIWSYFNLVPDTLPELKSSASAVHNAQVKQ